MTTAATAPRITRMKALTKLSLSLIAAVVDPLLFVKKGMQRAAAKGQPRMLPSANQYRP